MLKNAGKKDARVDLEPIGPFADFSMRRKILSSNDLYKKACMKPKTKVSQKFPKILLACSHFLLKFHITKSLTFQTTLISFTFTQGKKIKNIKRDTFGTKLGRVHMTSQDVSKLQTRKMKGLRKQKKTSDTKNKR